MHEIHLSATEASKNSQLDMVQGSQTFLGRFKLLYEVLCNYDKLPGSVKAAAEIIAMKRKCPTEAK